MVSSHHLKRQQGRRACQSRDGPHAANCDQLASEDCDVQLPRVENAYNNFVSTATRLASNEKDMGRLSPLPITAFEHPNIGGRQRLNWDQQVCRNLARDH